MDDTLESAARVIGANGMIVWVLDPARGCLVVHASRGYPEPHLLQAETIALDARVMTAAAYVDRRPQTRTRKGWHLAAVAVPIELDGRLRAY
ncbi:MAG: hypothetical protein R2712_03595 [Vicinamibacterales bacterium]